MRFRRRFHPKHQAEEIMRKIEKEEEILSYDDPDRKTFHLCIVNLVIGTLYCAKGNYQVWHGIPKELAVVLLNYQNKSFNLLPTYLL